MAKQRFTVTKDHIKLLKRMYTSWYDCEFGAPSIDPKRPYGNSNVIQDMCLILGLKKSRDEDEPYTQQQEEWVERLHKEMETVLQILVRNPSGIKAGMYETSDEYEVDWKLKK